MMRNGAPVVIGLGEILWDLLPSGKQLGGAPANFAFQAKALGARSAVISCVGEDELGHEILARLDGWGIDRTALNVDPGHPTGTVTVSVDDTGIPHYVIHEKVAWDHIVASNAAEDLAQTADAVCFGSLCQRSAESRQAIQRLLALAKPDCLRVFDVNLRDTSPGAEVILASLECASVAKLNDDELPLIAAMTGVRSTPDDALREMAERYGLRAVALTRGNGGSLVYLDGLFDDHPGYPVDVLDSVGAGDAFTAALTMGLLRGDPVDVISDHANQLAAAVCGARGGTPDLGGIVDGWRRPG